jgi:hypothetical protein
MALLKIGDACVSSRSVASLPDEKNEADDQDDDNQHPGLHLDAENVERLNEKLHGTRPFIVQGRAFGAKKILFIYWHVEVARPFRVVARKRKDCTANKLRLRARNS